MTCFTERGLQQAVICKARHYPGIAEVTLEAISSAATIALASTIAILATIKACHVVVKPFNGLGNFKHSIMVEAAQSFRDRLDSLRSEQSLYLTLLLMFVATFGMALLLRAQEMLGSLPAWQHIVVLTLVGLAACYGFYRFIRTVVERRRIAFVRDASIAIGHSLQQLTSNRNRVFHEVRCPGGIIDNVVVGLHGVYAVSVVARRPGKDRRARLHGDVLTFAPGKVSVPVAKFGAMARQLAKSLNQKVGHRVRVRPVIAVPGWEIESQASEDFLVVNERNVAMLSGWKDERDYLMSDDVESIHKFLTENGTRSASKNK